MTEELWHVTCDTEGVVNIVSRFQVPSSNCFEVMMFWRFGGKGWVTQSIINRPGVAGAVLLSPLLLIQSVTDWLFSSKSSKCLPSKTVIARELKFWENVDIPPCFACQLSRVMCHVSHVTCHLSNLTGTGPIKRVYHLHISFLKTFVK